MKYEVLKSIAGGKKVKFFWKRKYTFEFAGVLNLPLPTPILIQLPQSLYFWNGTII